MMVDIQYVKYVMIVFLRIYKLTKCDSHKKAFDKLCEREIKSIFEEVKMKDRQKLDSLVLSAIGLDPEIYLEKLYKGITQLVNERKLVAEMRRTVKKDKTRVDLQKVKERAIEEIINPNYKKFPNSFTFNFEKIEFKEVQHTGKPLKVSEIFFGTCKVFEENVKIYEGTAEEVKYLMYSIRPNEYIIKIPVNKTIVTKAVTGYEHYLEGIKQSLFDYLISRTHDTSATNKLISEILQEIFNLDK